MNRTAGLLGLLATVLVAALAAELFAGPDQDPDVAVVAMARPPGTLPPGTLPPGGAPAGEATDAAADGLAGLARSILARPLFIPGRHPPAPASAPADEELPRLAGVIVTPGGRRAIFAPAAGPAVVVPEGGMIGRYVVRSIAPGQVTLLDSGQQHVIHPAYAPASKEISQ